MLEVIEVDKKTKKVVNDAEPHACKSGGDFKDHLKSGRFVPYVAPKSKKKKKKKKSKDK